MASLRFRGVKKVYDGDVVAVQEFDLDIADQEFVVLVGPSGCGKSTTLRMIAGLEDITQGELYIGDRLVNDVPPKDRDIAMVFQNYALYPHMTVYKNIAFALKMRKMPKAIINEKVREAAEILNITQLLERKPKALSGGERQRVAIGRAIVREPKVFLMDEPLSNLDAKLRNQMRAEILKLRQRINTTFVYVTHDQVEAMTLGDRIVIMKDGYIRQVGTPQEVFDRPEDLFVASFIGTPQMNLLDAELAADGGRLSLAGGGHVALSETMQKALCALPERPGTVVMGVRPEHLRLAESGIPAKVDMLELMGSTINLHVQLDGRDVVAIIPAREDGRPPAVTKADIHLAPEPNRIHLFDKETKKRIM